MTKDNYVVTQNPQSTMKDKKTLSRQRIFKSRQTRYEVEENSIVIKTTIVTTEVEKKDIKTYVATQ